MKRNSHLDPPHNRPLNLNLFAITDDVLPLVALMYGLTAYLSNHDVRNTWLRLTGLIVATTLSAICIVIMRGALPREVPTRSIVAAYTTPYFILITAMGLAVLACRRWMRSRWFGVIALVLVFFVTRVVALQVSGHFLDFVNAAG